MKKISVLIITFILLCSVIAGCGSSPKSNETEKANTSTSEEMVNDNKSSETDPKAEVSILDDKIASINFDELNKITEDQFKKSETYPLIQDIAFFVKDNDTIVMSAIVGDSISKENLLSLADSMIRSYGSNAELYFDSNLKGPDKDYYGELFDKYNIFIIITPASNPKEKTYIYKSIPAGAHTKVKIVPTDDFPN